MIDWRDQLAGHRMQVDRVFADRIQESELSSHEWSLVMTAVEFEIEGAGADARLVADTSRIDAVLSEFDTDASRREFFTDGFSAGGLWDSITGAMGIGGDTQSDKRRIAVELANDYATELQRHLEERNQWEAIRRAGTSSSA